MRSSSHLRLRVDLTATENPDANSKVSLLLQFRYFANCMQSRSNAVSG